MLLKLRTVWGIKHWRKVSQICDCSKQKKVKSHRQRLEGGTWVISKDQDVIDAWAGFLTLTYKRVSKHLLTTHNIIAVVSFAYATTQIFFSIGKHPPSFTQGCCLCFFMFVWVMGSVWLWQSLESFRALKPNVICTLFAFLVPTSSYTSSSAAIPAVSSSRSHNNS